MTVAKSFAETTAGQERTILRKAITKTKALNHNRKAVLSKLVNLWFANRRKDVIHPGAARIAKETDLSERSVRAFMGEFRAAGWITPTKYAKGGRNATRYVVNLRAIIDALVPHNVVTLAAELVERVVQTAVEKPCKICIRYIPKGWGDVRHLTQGFGALLKRHAWHYQPRGLVLPRVANWTGGAPF